MSYHDLGFCLATCAFSCIVGQKGTYFAHFFAKTPVLAAGLVVGGVAFCFASDAEGLLRPSGVRDEANLRMLPDPVQS